VRCHVCLRLPPLLPRPTLIPFPLCSVRSSCREIVLGIDLPHWRNLSPVFPPYTTWHWEDVDRIREPECRPGGLTPLLTELTA
jgi:hypothetical protein